MEPNSSSQTEKLLQARRENTHTPLAKTSWAKFSPRRRTRNHSYTPAERYFLGGVINAMEVKQLSKLQMKNFPWRGLKTIAFNLFCAESGENQSIILTKLERKKICLLDRSRGSEMGGFGWEIVASNNILNQLKINNLAHIPSDAHSTAHNQA